MCEFAYYLRPRFACKWFLLEVILGSRLNKWDCKRGKAGKLVNGALMSGLPLQATEAQPTGDLWEMYGTIPVSRGEAGYYPTPDSVVKMVSGICL